MAAGARDFAGGEFYAAVFGYGTYKADFGEGGEAEGEDFTVWTASGAAVGSDTPGDAAAFCGRGFLGARHPPGTPPYILPFLPYFSVTDCDCYGAVAAALRLGGRVRGGPVDTAYGRHALPADDQGAGFAVPRPGPVRQG